MMSGLVVVKYISFPISLLFLDASRIEIHHVVVILENNPLVLKQVCFLAYLFMSINLDNTFFDKERCQSLNMPLLMQEKFQGS